MAVKSSFPNTLPKPAATKAVVKSSKSAVKTKAPVAAPKKIAPMAIPGDMAIMAAMNGRTGMGKNTLTPKSKGTL